MTQKRRREEVFLLLCRVKADHLQQDESVKVSVRAFYPLLHLPLFIPSSAAIHSP